MRRLDRLLDLAIEALPAGVRDRVIVFGSAPLVLHGLKPDLPRDLDLLADEATVAALAAAGFAREGGRGALALAPGVELHAGWAALDLAAIERAAAPREGSRGLRVASLADVLAIKRATNRPKDQEDIALLERALAGR